MLFFNRVKVCHDFFRQIVYVLDRRLSFSVQHCTSLSSFNGKYNTSELARPWKKTLHLFSSLKGYYQDRKFSEEVGNVSIDEKDIEAIMKDPDYEEFTDRVLRLPFHGHNVLVIQPFIKVGEKKKRNTTPQLQLDEAIALIHSLPNWNVIDSNIAPLTSFSKGDLFGSGTLEKLKKVVKTNHRISALFISVDILKTHQLIKLETHFGVPVYDRYRIVIQIFRNHAESQVSKLQIAKAEIPYLKQCLRGFYVGLEDRIGGAANVIGSSVKTDTETRRRLIFDREVKLRRLIQKVRNHRHQVRMKHAEKAIPTIAIVGYTNAGKTSLIKALSGEDRLKPRDQLFATLDVTKHGIFLPCNLRVLLVDTVGFISDIPSELLEPFTATLEDAVFADVIVHVWDVSNPDFQCQRDQVWSTLQTMRDGESLLERVFEVGNKIDKISACNLQEIKKREPEMMLVSAKTGTGMTEFLESLEKNVIKMTGRKRMIMRVETASPEYEWLRKEVPVLSIHVDEGNIQFSHLHVVLTQGQLAIFKHRFGFKK